MVDERPRQRKFSREFRAEGFHAERLRRVMPGVDEIYAQFLRRGERPMRSFTRQKRIHARRGRLRNFVARSARADAQPPHAIRPARGQMHRRLHRRLDAVDQGGQRHIDLRLHADFEKRRRPLDPERPREQRVVTETRMEIERQMRAVDRQARRHRPLQLAIERAVDPLRAAPEESVMHDQQIRARVRRRVDHRLAGIHRAGDMRDPVRIRELQAVVRVRIILDLRRPQFAVEKRHHIRELHPLTPVNPQNPVNPV